MKLRRIVLGTDIDDQVSNVQSRGMRYWRRATLDSNVFFIIDSPKADPSKFRDNEMDFLPRPYLTPDVFEATRIAKSVPSGNSGLSVVYKLEETATEWHIEPVRRILGSSTKAATIVITEGEHLNLPPQTDLEKPEPLEELFRDYKL